jgi:hypothetical protein
MRFLISFLTLILLASFSTGCSAQHDDAHSIGQSAGSLESPSLPPRTDYCEMLERDIQGEHYGFIAGNKLYYVAALLVPTGTNIGSQKHLVSHTRSFAMVVHVAMQLFSLKSAVMVTTLGAGSFGVRRVPHTAP